MVFLEVKDLINKNRQTYAICNCKCGNITEKPLSQLLAGDGCSCGCVTTSYGEASIAKILLDNNILFSREHKFKDLKSPKNAYLRYDFALWDKDKLVCLIEFDGLQHVDVNYQFGVKTIEEAYAKLKLIQFYDKLKNEYAEKHNIPLFRISYTRSYQEIEDKIINILKVMTLLY